MKIYLDMCAIQRPIDTPNQIRIKMEAEAVLGLISLCVLGHMDLVSSDALLYESRQITLPIRFEHTNAVLALAKEFIQVDENDKKRASEFVTQGLKTVDALHLVLAEKGKVNYFCTVDDGILRGIKRVSNLSIKVLNPMELVQEIEK